MNRSRFSESLCSQAARVAGLRIGMAGLLLAGLPLLAAYTYAVTDSFSSINSSTWVSNGTISGSSTVGLNSASSPGGSVIYKGGLLSSATYYEVKSTLKITASGGTFVMYTMASNDALSGSPQGSFYAAEFTPTLASGGCTMAGNFYKRVGGVYYSLGSGTYACKDGMTIRWSQRSGYFSLFTSLNEVVVIGDSSLTSGSPGFGARSLPAGNGISVGELGNMEFTNPNAVDATTIRSAVFDNRIDLAWTGVTDDVNGSGFMLYQIHRLDSSSNLVVMGNVRGAYFSDSTVTAGATYTYTIYPHDVHLNYVGTSKSVTAAAANQKDLRRTGVRPLGTYWGASPENIDLQSGNLSFSLPTVTAKGRGGTSVPFRLSYNSQNWRQDSSANWLVGTDVGFGFGWKMLAGSLTPVYSDWFTMHHYVYTDSTGAEYDLDVNNSGTWRSKAGIFVEYDAVAKRLYFPNGSYWEFDCTSSGTEADMGTMYPTRMVDSNGNEIKLRYQHGAFYAGNNSSARITEIEDVRATNVTGVYKSYELTYNSDAIPHLTAILSYVGADTSSFSFSYSTASALTAPFSGATSIGTAVDLHSMTLLTTGGPAFVMDYYSGSHELQKVTMPYGGTLEWAYGAKTLAGSRTIREVTTRYLNSQDTTGTKTYTLSHDDSGDASRLAHLYTTVADASGTADKKYTFNTSADFKLGFLSLLEERAQTSGTVLRSTELTWAQTSNGNPYINSSVETIEPTNTSVYKSSKTEQTISDQGNLLERKQYGFYTPGTTPPLGRTYTYTYLSGSNYESRHIFNRLLTVAVQKPGGSSITLVSNGYDYGGTAAVPNPSLLRQHDTANYGTSFTYRGNVTSTSRPGSTLTMTYDYTGTVLSTTDGYGHSASQTPDSSHNYAVPSSITAGPTSSTFTYNGSIQMTQATGANGEAGLTSYDTYLRPDSKTAPNGAVTNFSYGISGTFWTRATTGSRWTKSTMDGFGRTVKVESGYNSGGTAYTVSTVETMYAPCACSPMGKLWKTSLPYAPSGTVYWTEYTYDALGRTLSVKQPVKTGTSVSWGTSTYSYSGITVTSTDPAGKWKSFENDAFRNLVKVTEPRVGGGSDATTYTYSELGQLLTSTMIRPGKGSSAGTNVTQTRTWNYNSTTQRLASTIMPESGTTTYDYNPDGTLNYTLDAKSQKRLYTVSVRPSPWFPDPAESGSL